MEQRYNVPALRMFGCRKNIHTPPHAYCDRTAIYQCKNGGKQMAKTKLEQVRARSKTL